MPSSRLSSLCATSDDEAADTVDLRLAGEALRLGNGLSQSAWTVVGDELWNDRQDRSHGVALGKDDVRERDGREHEDREHEHQDADRVGTRVVHLHVGPILGSGVVRSPSGGSAWSGPRTMPDFWAIAGCLTPD